MSAETTSPRSRARRRFSRMSCVATPPPSPNWHRRWVLSTATHATPWQETGAPRTHMHMGYTVDVPTATPSCSARRMSCPTTLGLTDSRSENRATSFSDEANPNTRTRAIFSCSSLVVQRRDRLMGARLLPVWDVSRGDGDYVGNLTGERMWCAAGIPWKQRRPPSSLLYFLRRSPSSNSAHSRRAAKDQPPKQFFPSTEPPSPASVLLTDSQKGGPAVHHPTDPQPRRATRSPRAATHSDPSHTTTPIPRARTRRAATCRNPHIPTHP